MLLDFKEFLVAPLHFVLLLMSDQEYSELIATLQCLGIIYILLLNELATHLDV